MTDWLFENYLELLGVTLSILYLLLSIRQNILLWPVGIVGAMIYMVVFFQSKFYADMGLNGYYFLISIYGWITWSRARVRDKHGMAVAHAGITRCILLLTITFFLFLLIGYLLENYTDSPIPYWDALTTSGSIVATWMLTRKIIEHWIVWVIVDLISLGLYVYRGLYPTAVLFAIYTAMAVIGYIQWNRSLKDCY
ncbi:MAG: nicotinamide riboside transporter PnuC [Bacteroidales bacterium]